MQTMSLPSRVVRVVLVCLAALAWARSAAAQPAYRVSPVVYPGFPGTEFVEMNGQLFYPAYSGGWGLWKSDGTTAGTTLVKAGVTADELTVVSLPGGDRLFFSNTQAATGTELWISDGTDVGTVLLKDIRPGSASSDPKELRSVSFTALGNRLVFRATNGTNGQEIWTSDGTAVGTVMLKDANAGAADGFPFDFVERNGTLFYASKCSSGCGTFWGLWKSDGTPAGTVLVSGAPILGWLVNATGGLFFVGDQVPNGPGYEVWTSDGTGPGTVIVKDIVPGTGSSFPRALTPIDDIVYFSASDGTNGEELWRTDGTDAGTFMVQNIVPGNNPYFSGPDQLRNVNGRLYFAVDDGVSGKELWTGDSSGATLVKDINPGPGSSLGYANVDPTLTLPGLVVHDCNSFGGFDDKCTVIRHANGLDYFFADDGTSGSELWQTDGTGPGTSRLQDIYPGPDDSFVYYTGTRIAGGHLFFGARGPTIAATDYSSLNLWAIPLSPSLVVGDALVSEGNAGTTPATFTVMVYPPSASPVSVDFATANGTATAGVDYQGAAGTLTFGPGVGTQTVPVTVNGDTQAEANETFFVNLSNPVGVPIASGQGIGTIVNDDGPGISVSDNPAQIESGIAIFFVTLSASSTDVVTVDYATADGTAQAGSDYTAASGSLTFAPGETFKTVNVNITSDTLDEPDENFFLNLSNPTFAFLLDGQGETIIIDDDATPSLTINNVSLTEPNPPVIQNMTFTITLSAASGQPVTVDYATADGTTNPATAGVDYVPSSGTLTIPPGSLSASRIVGIIGDNVDELNETLNLNLTNAVNANISDGLGVGTINDNDTTNITIPDVTVAENVASGLANFTVTLSAPFHLDITLDYATADGTALAPLDYTAVSGTLTIPAGASSAGISVPIVDDNLDEPATAETFFVNLSNNSGGNLTDAQGKGNITDDDVSNILITSVSLPEGDTGTTPFVFDITLDGPSVNTITVHYATVAGTATAPSDYTTTSGTLTFSPGSTSAPPVTVDVNGDTTAEPNETFQMDLSAVTGTTDTNPASGNATILNDDSAGFVVNDVTVTEGNAGSINATFTVTLQGAFSGTPSVDFATADGSAVAGSDYTAGSGTLTFTTGVSTRTLTVPVLGDTLDEANEDFFVNLTNPQGGPLINDPQGIGTITDNDTTSITVNNVTVAENVASGLADFVVTFSVPNAQVVTLDYATADGTAVAPGDYTAAAGTLTIPAGTTSMGISVPIIDDTLDEPATAEGFSLNLSNSSGPTITDGLGLGSITDNDTSTLAIGDVSVIEGDAGTVDAVFTVSLGGGKTNAVTVNFATAAGATNPATPGVDYTTTTGTLSFPACAASPCPPGSLTQSLTVPVLGDVLIEADETFVVNLSGATGATISDAQGKGTIVDNDGLPSLSISDVSVIEPGTGTTNAVFTVTLAPTSGLAVTVSYATADGTATAPGDYTAATGTLSFAPGASTRTITVVVNSDVVPETTEDFLVNLSNPVNADFTDSQGQGTISDPTLAFTVNDVTVTEGNAGSINATFTVTLQGTIPGTPSVDFATADGSAVAGSDYTATSGTLTFTTGVSTRTFTVPVLGDTLDEANEDFFVNLTNPQGGPVINDPQGVGTITDNDTTSITVNNVTVAENVASGLANFVVTFSAPNDQVVTLDYATADGTAVAPGDYTAAAGTLTFPSGTTSMGISVPIIDDTLDEPATAEGFSLNLSNSSGPTITDGLGLGSITDNDTSTLAIGDVSVIEGDAGTVDAVFTVSLGGGKTNAVTVNFATAAGATNPATPDVDYTTTTGTLSFPACAASPCPPGSLTQSVTVPVIGDVLTEADETFVVNLSGATGATISDPQGKGTIVDNDGLPSLSISDVSVIEPGTGTTNAVFTVTLAPTSGLAVTVSYATADGTATAPADYTAITGSLSFAPGASTRSITVVVKSDAIPEATEDFLVNLTNPVNADFTDGQGQGTILDPTFATTELVHGSVVQADLAALNPTTADQDRYRIQQPPRVSWEVLVDGVSGDLPPVLLERLSSTGAVLQTAVPAGGSSVSLRWTNAGTTPVTGDRIRVAGGCGVNCDAQDLYRIQALDTTYRVGRYNNSATQITILVLQNPTDDPVTGTTWFWNGLNGSLNGSQAFTIPPKGILSLNTSSVSGVASTSGSITVTNDAPYGALIGKAVSVESATGFTFDTALEARTR